MSTKPQNCDNDTNEQFELPDPKITASFSDLPGKVAIVTGAAGGIGIAVCRYLATQGVKIVANDLSEKSAPTLCGLLDEDKADYIYASIDISSRDGAAKLADMAQQKYGTPDILVNIAGRLGSGPFLKTDEETLIGTTELNIRLCYFISRIVAERMVESDISGSIINFSSVGADRAHGGQVLYDTSKGAINALTRAMAVDLARHNIRVNAVVPGVTISRYKNYGQWLQKHLVRKPDLIPLGRVGVPEDIAPMVGFLASESSGYATGSVFNIDGGIMAQLSPPGTSI